MRKLSLLVLQRYFRYRYGRKTGDPRAVDKAYEFFVEKRLEQKAYRRHMAVQQTLINSRAERMEFVHKVRHQQMAAIKARLQVYHPRHEVVTNLLAITTQTFNQFSKVYQVQINVDSLADLVSARNISNVCILA